MTHLLSGEQPSTDAVRPEPSCGAGSHPGVRLFPVCGSQRSWSQGFRLPFAPGGISVDWASFWSTDFATAGGVFPSLNSVPQGVAALQPVAFQPSFGTQVKAGARQQFLPHGGGPWQGPGRGVCAARGGAEPRGEGDGGACADGRGGGAARRGGVHDGQRSRACCGTPPPKCGQQVHRCPSCPQPPNSLLPVSKCSVVWRNESKCGKLSPKSLCHNLV